MYVGQRFIRIYQKLREQQFQGVIGEVTKVDKIAGETNVVYKALYTWGGFNPGYGYGASGKDRYRFLRHTGFDAGIILDPEKHPDRVFEEIFQGAK